MQSSQKDKIEKAHNIFRAEYIKSLLSEQQAAKKITILKGLIATSKKLGYPYKEYESELYYLIGNKKINSLKPKKSFSKKSYKKLRVTSKQLTKILLKRGYVEFYFNAPLTSKDIKFYRKKNRHLYQNIYEIKAQSRVGDRRYKLRTISSMQVLNVGNKKLQIIFSDTKPPVTKKVIKGSKLSIYLGKYTKNIAMNKTSTKAKGFSVPQLLPIKNKVIVIDPGHGGHDSGAVGYRRKREKDVVLQIAKRLYSILKKKGYKVYMTRKSDYFVTLRNRTRFANRVKAHLFISIHANAAPNRIKAKKMQGLETFYLSPSRSERAKRVAALENRVDVKNMSYFSKQVYLDFLNREKTILSNKLAIDIQRNVLFKVRKKYSLVDGGVRPGPFWVLVGAQMPAVLVEVGYITHPKEALRLSSPYYQRLIAEGIAAGITSYFIHNQR